LLLLGKLLLIRRQLYSQEEITKPGLMDMQQEVQYSKIFTSLFIRSFVSG